MLFNKHLSLILLINMKIIQNKINKNYNMIKKNQKFLINKKLTIKKKKNNISNKAKI